jgi:methylmalonyl-CoA decarboxylase subunit alpha
MEVGSEGPLDVALAELDRRRRNALALGGPEKVAKQHGLGRLTARERVDLLVDPGSFVEIGQLALSDRPEMAEKSASDAIVVGVATLDGRKIALVAGDATVMAGSTGRVGGRKQSMIVHLAARKGYPLVVLGDANGGRLPDFLGSVIAGMGGSYEGEDMFGTRWEKIRIPRVTAALGNTYGDPTVSAALSDFVVMPENCTIGLSGPGLVSSAVGQQTTHAEMCGPDVVAKQSGLVSNVVVDEPECMAAIRRFLSYLPSNASLPPPRIEPREPKTPPEALRKIVPEQFNRAYNAHKVLDAVVDEDSLFELRPQYGRSLISALARIEGRAVGVLMNQPMYNAGVLDAASMIKAHKFVDMCDDFGLPLVFLQDMPGLIIGEAAEKTGIALRMAELYRRVSKAKVPRVTVVIRKAYGAGAIILGGPSMGVDYCCMWASARFGFMAAANSVQVLHGRKLAAMRATEGDEAADAMAARLEEELGRDDAPWTAAELAYIHDVIKPEDTRQAVIRGLFLGEGYL